MTHGLPIRQLLAVLLAIPAFALTFFVYQTGNIYVALALLVVTCLGVYTYVSPSASTFRYLFPGFLGFGLFVIFPLVYTIYIGFTKYSSENLLTFDRALALFLQIHAVFSGRWTVCLVSRRREGSEQTLCLGSVQSRARREAKSQLGADQAESAASKRADVGQGDGDGSNQPRQANDPP